jgi:hypothetical protein
VRIENGYPTSALADDCGGEHNLATLLLPLFGWETGRFEFVPGEDLVGEHAVLHGKVDPLPLITAASRGCIRSIWIAQAIERIERSLVQKSRRFNAERYGFTPDERNVIAAIDLGLFELDDIRRRAGVAEHVLRRVLYVLVVTQAISLVPKQRAISGTIRRSQPPGAPTQPALPRAPERVELRNSRPPAANQASAPPAAPSASARPVQPTSRPAPPVSQRVPSPRSTAATVPRLPSARARKSVPPNGRGAAPAAPASGRSSNGRPSSSPSIPRAEASSQRPVPPSPSSQRPVAAGSQRPATSTQPPVNDIRARREESEALWAQADALAMRGDFGAALDMAHAATKVFPATPEHEALIAWLMLQHAGGHESVHSHVWRCLERAHKRDPLCEQVLYYKGLVLNVMGDIEEAHIHFQRVLMIKPDHPEANREIRLYEMRKAHARNESNFLRRLFTGRPKGE